MTGVMRENPRAGITTEAQARSLPVDDPHDTAKPDTPRPRPTLPMPSTLAWGTGFGAGLGALLLRSRGAGWSLGAIASGAWKGAAVGAGLGATLVGIDRLTDGKVRKQVDFVLDRRAQILFVLSNPTRP